MLSIEDLPALMDKMRWPVAAELMRRWFAGSPGWAMPPLVKAGTIPMGTLAASRIDQSTVTLDWLQGFERVRQGFALAEKAWQHQKSIDLLKLKIARSTATKGPMPWRFGDLSGNATQVDADCQVNYVAVGASGDPLDDFYGAIGRGLLKVAVSGMVSAPQRRKQIAIDRIGVYLRDTYDFNGDQFLGVWNKDGVVGNRLSQLWGYVDGYPDIPIKAASGADSNNYRVTNDSFRKWRDANRKGADFIVISKVAVQPLARPVIIAL